MMISAKVLKTVIIKFMTRWMMSGFQKRSIGGLPNALVHDELMFRQERQHMVDISIHARGVTNTAVLQAMNSVPRHLFVPPSEVSLAYQDSPLPIGFDQTISQPYIVAFMTEAALLQIGDHVLEVGTGCGYGAAVASEVVGDEGLVFTIETIPELAESARQRLSHLNFANVRVAEGDGSLGLPEHAPYNAIIVTAGAPKIPKSLLAQLVVGGKLVIPVNDRHYENLIRVTKIAQDDFRQESLMPVQFVPLIGKEAY
jgi:protein-L-isoaspartate(D-aspartate) O-methyltransferase